MSRRKEIVQLKNRLEEMKKEMISIGNYDHYEEVREKYNRLKKKYLFMSVQERSRRKPYSSRHPHKYPRRSIHKQ
jgi:uncharacterized coiled-coil DUF342 family protein